MKRLFQGCEALVKSRKTRRLLGSSSTSAVLQCSCMFDRMMSLYPVLKGYKPLAPPNLALNAIQPDIKSRFRHSGLAPSNSTSQNHTLLC